MTDLKVLEELDLASRAIERARAMLAGEGPVLVDAASDIDRARREGWAQGMIDTLKNIQAAGKITVQVKCEVCPHEDGCVQCERDGECVAVHRVTPSPSPAVRDAPYGKCVICGEPMPKGEETFKFHGYSGDCPKPPLSRGAVRERKP